MNDPVVIVSAARTSPDGRFQGCFGGLDRAPARRRRHQGGRRAGGHRRQPGRRSP